MISLLLLQLLVGQVLGCLQLCAKQARRSLGDEVRAKPPSDDSGCCKRVTRRRLQLHVSPHSTHGPTLLLLVLVLQLLLIVLLLQLLRTVLLLLLLIVLLQRLLLPSMGGLVTGQVLSLLLLPLPH